MKNNASQGPYIARTLPDPQRLLSNQLNTFCSRIFFWQCVVISHLVKCEYQENIMQTRIRHSLKCYSNLKLSNNPCCSTIALKRIVGAISTCRIVQTLFPALSDVISGCDHATNLNVGTNNNNNGREKGWLPHRPS